MGDKKTAQPATWAVPERVNRPSRFFRFFKLVLLVSAAVSLSYLLQNPWAGFYGGSTSPQGVRQRPLGYVAGWKDDVWPIREQTPWDISTDYPYPRKLEYSVTEGTWLRLDVHPKTGEIVFDMLGDVYCLPANAYSQDNLISQTVSNAKPILLGVPHDSDPHFSPDGEKIVFRSDAGLGVENIWVMPYTSCGEMDLRPTHPSGNLLTALGLKETEDDLLAAGHRETEEVKKRRLLREGRLTAQRVTNETYRWVSDARFHPSGSKIIATKWFTSSRSIGAGEGWEYPVPSSHATIKAGSGKQLVGRTLPLGWSPEKYGDQQVGPEQFIWHGRDTLIYSKNVQDTNGQYSYSKDVHKGIYAIFSTNLTTHETTVLVDSFPGGATRPELSRDGRTLAFVRRVRDKEALVLKDLVTGTIHHVWHGLTYDLGVISAPMGTYPSFAFTPSDDAIIIWSAGQIYHVPLKTNKHGERVLSGDPATIPFRANVEKRIAETVAPKTDLLTHETEETQRVYAFTDLRANEAGSKVVFQAAGVNYVHGTKEGTKKIQTLTGAPYFSPSFVPHTDDLVVHARWSDVDFTTFELANLTSAVAYEFDGLPLGRYYSPILCECVGSQRYIAFVKTGGDYMTGDIVATAKPGLYTAKVTLPSPTADSSHKITLRDIQFISAAVTWDDASKTKVKFIEKNTKILVQQSQEAFIIDLSEHNEFGHYKHETISLGAMSTEIAASVTSDFKRARHVAFVDFFHVYFASGVRPNEPVWSKPGSATLGLARLSLDGGHDVVFSGDGKTLFWLLGPYLHSIEVSKLASCSSHIANDPVNFGISCTKNILKFHEIVVSHSSDVHRLKTEAQASAAALHANDGVALANADYLVIYNATLLMMENDDSDSDVLHDAMLFVRGGKISAIVGARDAVIPYGSTAINAQGGYVIPGFIDAHAHWNGFADYYPSRSWELETFLAYGVTTLHNPSSDTVRGFWERSRLERGQLTGPRIYHTGDIIYGGGAPGIHQDIVSMEEAYSALIRIKAEGGPASFSYKNYNLPSRASRQRLLLAARNLSMICVPEGGMNYDWDQTYIVDGMTTIEHPLPIPSLWDDIIDLYARSGTGSTPTHIVNYGGVMGEQLIWATQDIPNDPKLRLFTRHDVLESVAESTARPRGSYALFNTSASTAKMVHKGLRTHIGAHGEPPLGLNYHAEMYFAKEGGLTNYEVIRAATSDAARTLGIFDSLGSLTPGKLADFLIYPPGVDLLNGDIASTKDLKYVVRGGRVWDAATLTEVWPVKGKREPMPPLNPE